MLPVASVSHTVVPKRYIPGIKVVSTTSHNHADVDLFLTTGLYDRRAIYTRPRISGRVS